MPLRIPKQVDIRDVTTLPSVDCRTIISSSTSFVVQLTHIRVPSFSTLPSVRGAALWGQRSSKQDQRPSLSRHTTKSFPSSCNKSHGKIRPLHLKAFVFSMNQKQKYPRWVKAWMVIIVRSFGASHKRWCRETRSFFLFFFELVNSS